jgi:hypothetical protein
MEPAMSSVPSGPSARAHGAHHGVDDFVIVIVLNALM